VPESLLQPGVLVPLVAFAALAVLFALILRRAGRLLATMREADAFRGAVADLAARIDISLGGVVERIDVVRRHQLPSDAIEENLAAATEAVQRYAEEAEALRPPPALSAQRDGLVAELERAGRALEMVVHGSGLLASRPGGARELEAQTAIKRGYLNLIHAREAIRRLAIEAATLTAAGGSRVFGRRGLKP
jgi:hypothetical protein